MRRVLAVSAVFLFLLTACTTQEPKPAGFKGTAAIASAHPLATEAGMRILEQGGNAFDAAIAVAASLGVVEPYSAGIGGGGFWLLYDAEQKRYHFVDARETAPGSFHRDYYLNEDGSVNRDKAVNGPTAGGIPGQPAAFAYLAEHYGRLPLTESLKDAIHQARNGFEIDEHYQMLMGFRFNAIKRYAESAEIFLDDMQVPGRGFLLKQPDLADTLATLANDGFDGFYRGPLASRMVDEVNKAGGDWTLEDLAGYEVKEREPVRIRIGDTELISAPPPSSGGIAIAQMLKMLEHFDWQTMNQTDQLHLLTEVMRRAYRDRAEFLGDPDFVDVPVASLISDQRNQDWASDIDMARATPSIDLKGPKNIQEGFHTTHLSVVDADGNRVSATLSINLPFGSAFTIPGTGVLLNNEMDDFSAKPGEPNAYGLVGNEANAIAAGKRPLSSMSPSMLESPDSIAILGTPGGSRIISMVFLGALEYLQGKPVEDWVTRARIHHQYLPDAIQHEPGVIPSRVMDALEARGHTFKDVGRQYGNMQAILIDKTSGEVTAAADPRGIGAASVVTH
ncbi:gamma-glutamyltransferase [uncultured Thalassolituus sp.]|uniref:gamma-glutamyltransferase n=2 Tax=uncultured Thalassolituus sp. TaxID=285273 RepID=UPI002635D5E4|nr:gamma-glutamyltransferase [uncultured Thalassolituus sp.]